MSIYDDYYIKRDPTDAEKILYQIIEAFEDCYPEVYTEISYLEEIRVTLNEMFEQWLQIIERGINHED